MSEKSKSPTITFKLPCYATVGRRRVSLTLNWYRNAHYQQSNAVKAQYAPCGGSFRANQIRIHYTLVLDNDRRTDVMNWIAVADKFFCDWMVKAGMIPDDDKRRVAGVTSGWMTDSLAEEKYIIAEIEVLK